MSEHNSRDNDLSYNAVRDFLVSSSRTILFSAVLIGTAGVIVSFVLPAKYSASVSVASARVDGNAVESATSLLERMKSPSFYSADVFRACGMDTMDDPDVALLRFLKIDIPRNSEAVRISIKHGDPDVGVQCLSAVVNDVERNQQSLWSALVSRVEEKLRQSQTDLIRLEKQRTSELDLLKTSLEIKKQHLTEIRASLRERSTLALELDVSNADFPSRSLMVATIRDLQRTANSLELEIGELELRLKEQLPDQTTVNAISNAKFTIAQLQITLRPPITSGPSYFVPITVSKSSVEPQKGLIWAASVFLGAFVGLMWSLLRKVRRRLQYRS